MANKNQSSEPLIQISLSHDEYRDLVGILDMGLLIKEAVREIRGEPKGEFSSVERRVLEAAADTDAEDFSQVLGKKLMPSDEIMDETEKEINEYIEDQFWVELSDRLGQRDFLENVTEEDLEAFESGEGAFPDGVKAYYDKYDREFDKHGLDRLRVDGR